MAKRGSTVSEVVPRRLREARASRLWTQGDLANEMSTIGSPMHRTTIAKIEKAKRPVAVDELVALAAALDVSPTFLLLPLDGKEPVQAAPKVVAEAETLGRWMAGLSALKESNKQTYRAHVPEWVAEDRIALHQIGAAEVQMQWLNHDERLQRIEEAQRQYLVQQEGGDKQ